jgi:hypothetical protein
MSAFTKENYILSYDRLEQDSAKYDNEFKKELTTRLFTLSAVILPLFLNALSGFSTRLSCYQKALCILGLFAITASLFIGLAFLYKSGDFFKKRAKQFHQAKQLAADENWQKIPKAVEQLQSSTDVLLITQAIIFCIGLFLILICIITITLRN